MVRWIALAALLLTVVVTTSSAHIRLVQSGLGCVPWPACHARTAPEASEVDRMATARALHRASASVVGVLILVLAIAGWARFDGSERIAAASAVALVVGLALLGRATPSPAPLVTQGNLIGGFALVGALAWLAAPVRRAPSACRGAVVMALAAIALQSVLGALLSVRHAVAACPDLGGCAWSVEAALLHPLAATPPMLGEDIASAGRQGLQTLHRLGGLAVLACVGWAALGLYRRGRYAAAMVIVAVALAQTALGLATALHGAPLGAAVAHNGFGAALVAALLWSARGARSATHAGSYAWS